MNTDSVDRWLCGTMDINRRLLIFCSLGDLAEFDMRMLASHKLGIHPGAFTLTRIDGDRQSIDEFDANEEARHLRDVIGHNGSSRFVVARWNNGRMQEKIDTKWIDVI